MKNIEQSGRQLKVAELIKQSLADIFIRKRGLDRRLIDNSITITNVKISPDLKQASCFFLPFTSKITPAEMLEALESSRFAIRAQVTESIKIRFSPELRFFYDQGAENALEVESVLHKINGAF